MESRKSKAFISIPVPFQLAAMQEQWPAGTYQVTTEEEPLGDFMFEAFRRVATTIYLPPRAGDFGVGQVLPVNPSELAQVLSTVRTETHESGEPPVKP
jgi:hypothetical protein